MNLTAVFLFIACIGLKANGFSQSIHLSERNAKLEKVFKKISRQTGYTFVYTESVLKKSKEVNIVVQSGTLEQVLQTCFSDQPLTYTIFNKMVVIKERPAPRQKDKPEIAEPELVFLEIKGKITDDKGAPLQGASIIVKGKNYGVQSDAGGNFSINAEPGALLVISYIGFQTTEIKINNQSFISVKLNPSEENAVKEVVITALGIKKEKKALGYAVTEVKGDELTEARSVNIGNSLAGKVAGLNISTPASGANGATRITIRGNGSISGNNQPLIVVDGTPINNDAGTLGPIVSTLHGDFQGYDKGDGISSLNPDEIESISVLKGATAAALYGSRASNGAILVTTKSAKAGKGIGVEAGFNATSESLLINDLGYQKEYGHGTGGVKPTTVAQAKAGRFSWGGKIDGTDAMFYDGVTRPYVAQKNNYNDFYNTGRSLISTVALTGASESIKYRFSYSNLDYKGILPTNTTKRNNFALNLNSNLSKYLSLLVNVKYIKEKNHNRPRVNGESGSTTFGILALPSTIPLSVLRDHKYDANGYDNTWNDNLFTVNPYYGVEDFKEDDDKNRLIGAIEPKLQITDWLYVKARFGMDYFNYNEQEIIPYGFAAQLRGGLTQRKRTFGEYNTDVMLSVNRPVTKNINFNAIVGTNFMKQITDGTDFFASNSFNIPFFYDISNIDPASRSYSQAHIEKRINSVYGTAEVSYKSFLYLNGGARNDWFSTLSAGKNSILYPSVGISFIASDALRLPHVINFLKLRGAWAQAGGDTDPYNLSLNYGLNGSNLGMPLGQINTTNVPNANLQPLTSTTSEFGFETRLLNNRINIDFTAYTRKTTNDIVAATISQASGYNTALFNVGAVSNKGIELLLGGTPVKSKDFSWDASFNMGYNVSKVISLYGNLTTLRMDQGRYGTAFIDQIVGKPYGQLTGFDYKRDTKGNIVYSATGAPQKGDLVDFGSGVSPYQLGFSNTFRYKNFSLSTLIDGRFGGYIYSGTKSFAYRFGLAKETVAGRESGIVGAGVNEAGGTNAVSSTAQNFWGSVHSNIASLMVFKSDFIKLRQVVLDYSFPAAKLSKLHIKGITVGLVARNIAILMKKTGSLDPESNFNNGNAQGLEFGSAPTTRNIGVNLNVKF